MHVVSGESGDNMVEVNFAMIKLTDEIRELDGRIIDCHYVDNQCWVFSKLRDDRKYPNVKLVIESMKLFDF